MFNDERNQKFRLNFDYLTDFKKLDLEHFLKIR